MNNKPDSFLGALALAMASNPAFASGSDDQGSSWLGAVLGLLFLGALIYIQLVGGREERIRKREAEKQAAKFATDAHNKMLD
ncbi:MAG: hypothetical protein ABL877_13630 [Thiobacillus sp.]